MKELEEIDNTVDAIVDYLDTNINVCVITVESAIKKTDKILKFLKKDLALQKVFNKEEKILLDKLLNCAKQKFLKTRFASRWYVLDYYYSLQD